jgi:hypothetical protein
MEIELATPALLFSALSLIMLAYTNRFLGLASVIRKLHADHKQSPQEVYVRQIHNLRLRIRLIRDMQTMGMISLLLCAICMFTLFFGLTLIGNILFVASLLFFIASIMLSIVEIRMSVGALDLHLKDIESER